MHEFKFWLSVLIQFLKMPVGFFVCCLFVFLIQGSLLLPFIVKICIWIYFRIFALVSILMCAVLDQEVNVGLWHIKDYVHEVRLRSFTNTLVLVILVFLLLFCFLGFFFFVSINQLLTSKPYPYRKILLQGNCDCYMWLLFGTSFPNAKI